MALSSLEPCANAAKPASWCDRHLELAAHSPPASQPKVWSWALRAFAAYTKPYLRRHFHSIRIARAGFSPDRIYLPAVVYLNHASWWDPLVCLFLHRHFFSRCSPFAPIDARALRKYPLFGRLGFFGVEQGTAQGAREFLRTAGAIMQERASTLWITPQGRFQDVRERPLEFHSGLGCLAGRWTNGSVLPLAVEYVFWEERLPEVLIRFGQPIDLSSRGDRAMRAGLWTRLFEERLAEVQDALAADAKSRDVDRFETLLVGREGVSLTYDAWRRCLARWKGVAFKPGHGATTYE